MTFKRHGESVSGGNWPRLDHAAVAPEGSAGISFWARSTSAQTVRISIEFRQLTGGDETVFAASRTIGPGWQLFQIAQVELRPIWQRRTAAKFNWPEVRRISFASAAPDSEGAVLIDQLRFDVRK